MQKQVRASFLSRWLQCLDLMPVILGEQLVDLFTGDIQGLVLELHNILAASVLAGCFH